MPHLDYHPKPSQMAVHHGAQRLFSRLGAVLGRLRQRHQIDLLNLDNHDLILFITQQHLENC